MVWASQNATVARGVGARQAQRKPEPASLLKAAQCRRGWLALGDLMQHCAGLGRPETVRSAGARAWRGVCLDGDAGTVGAVYVWSANATPGATLLPFDHAFGQTMLQKCSVVASNAVFGWENCENPDTCKRGVEAGDGAEAGRMGRGAGDREGPFLSHPPHLLGSMPRFEPGIGGDLAIDSAVGHTSASRR